jgi:uncharacterized protein (TIGR02145 family)
MKTIFNFMERTHWFKGIVTFLAGLLFIGLPSCEKNASVQDILISPSASASTVKIIYGKVKDIEGNEYKTVKIGKQIWMAENLKTTKLYDGTSLLLVFNTDAGGPDFNTPAYCWYNDDALNKVTYGALYNWHAVNTGKLCPKGWHVPSDAEWTTLTTYLGGEALAGDKLREKGTAHWDNNNDLTNPATDEVGFTALPGGSHIVDNDFTKEYFWGLRNEGYWWTSTAVMPEGNPYLAWQRYMAGDVSEVDRWYQNKNQANSIRCLSNK